MNNIFIPILLGTAREGRRSENVAKFVLFELKKHEIFDTELIDVRDFVSAGSTWAMTKEKAEKWREIIKRADGLIIVSPEYNHGYPGELKIMLDQLYEEYHFKPVAICGVSIGGFGGARMVESLRIVLAELHMPCVRDVVYFSNVGQLFDEAGNIKDSSYADKLKVMFHELGFYAESLKNGRINHKSS